MHSPMPIVGVESDTQNDQEAFLLGTKMTLDMCQKVLKTFDHEWETGPHTVFMNTVEKGVKYEKLLQRLGFKKTFVRYGGNYLSTVGVIKRLLNKSPLQFPSKDVVYVESSRTLTKEERAVLVRYINMCLTPKFIVVYGDEIIYVPESKRFATPESVGRYARIQVLRAKDQKTIKERVKISVTPTWTQKLVYNHQ